jgi:hypothetical protein
MNRTKYTELVAFAVTVAEAERQFRDVKGLIDRSLGRAQQFWLAAPLLFGAWAYMVSDDERFEVLEGLADQFFKLVPLEPVERWLRS